MRHEWRLPAQTEYPSALLGRQIREVLVEYDGPQLAVVVDEKSNDQYLALSVDDGPGFIRWLQVPVSHLELQALQIGAEPLRDAFLKMKVIVADYLPNFSPIAVWEVSATEIPDSAFPIRGAMLPEPEEIAAFKSRVEPGFSFYGKAPIDDAVSFGQLSSLSRTIQELWSTVAEAEFGVESPPVLYALVPKRGSLRIPVHTADWDLFSRVAARYQQLVWASSDADALDRTLRRAPLSVASSFERHLQAVANQRIEVLTQWPDGACFVGHDIAIRARQYFPDVQTEQEPVPYEDRRLRGHFENFWRARRWNFEFYDLETGDTLVGKIDQALRPRLQADFNLILGRTDREYLADIRITHADPPTYTLLNFS